jgi:predicted nucleic acid-binding protein
VVIGPRQDAPSDVPEVKGLRQALSGDDIVVTTGIVLQELLQGVVPSRSRSLIVERFAALTSISPSVREHIEAAEVRNECRRHGVRLGTIDALIAALCVSREITLLTTDRDFVHAARHVALRLWRSE